MQQNKVLILDFGSQYTQLIARRVREAGVYSEIQPCTISFKELKRLNPAALILSGGSSVLTPPSEVVGQIFDLGVPVLGICYGMQLMAQLLGGSVAASSDREYGKVDLTLLEQVPLLQGIDKKSLSVWMPRGDAVLIPPPDFCVIAKTSSVAVAAMANVEKRLYALQFHPEVVHSEDGEKIIRNFLFAVAGLQATWNMSSFVANTVENLKRQIGGGKALCALSGGVDSSVAAVLLSRAIGKQLTCVFVDHGLLRQGESEAVAKVFDADGPYELNFVKVDARKRFYEKLKGVTEPERKRKIIGEEFIRVFEEQAQKIGAVDFLVQGTIYPDVVESGIGVSAVIKSHHNVGGLPDFVDFKEIVEPLRNLFKDEVRAVGRELGIPEKFVSRQPFPGPGLGIRIIGEVTEEKVKIVQQADAIYREEIDKSGCAKDLGQYFAALTNMHSVGVTGDSRTYDYAVALRAVLTSDFMTAGAARLPWEVLEKVSARIVNEVKGVNRVLYDCTCKPPATIEFE